jgi:hypothetical protein
MKKLFLLLVTVTLMVSCKKQNVAPAPTPKIDESLVAHYSMNDTLDLSPYKNHAKKDSAKLMQDRKGSPNAAYDFVNNYFESSNIPINLKNNYTFSFWIKMNSYEDGMAVMELTKNKECNGNPQIWQWQNSIYLTPTKDPFNSIKIMSLGGIKTGTESPTWKHVLWTVHNDSTSVYVNGNLVGTKIMTWPDLSNVDLTLGNSGNGCGQPSNYHNQPSRVSIDEVRIYKRVLSFTEIRELSRF